MDDWLNEEQFAQLLVDDELPTEELFELWDQTVDAYGNDFAEITKATNTWLRANGSRRTVVETADDAEQPDTGLFQFRIEVAHANRDDAG